MVKRRLSSRKNITSSFGYIFRLVSTNPSQSYHQKIILPSYFQQNRVFKNKDKTTKGWKEKQRCCSLNSSQIAL